jgi:hypothetical protein
MKDLLPAHYEIEVRFKGKEILHCALDKDLFKRKDYANDASESASLGQDILQAIQEHYDLAR